MCTTTETASFSMPFRFHGTLLGLLVDTVDICLRESKGGVKPVGAGAAAKPAGDTCCVGFPAGGIHTEPDAAGGGGAHAEPGAGEGDIHAEEIEAAAGTRVEAADTIPMGFLENAGAEGTISMGLLVNAAEADAVIKVFLGNAEETAVDVFLMTFVFAKL